MARGPSAGGFNYSEYNNPKFEKLTQAAAAKTDEANTLYQQASTAC
jgi:ABC-type oligopeptide transport system substrate-binding subunit